LRSPSLSVARAALAGDFERLRELSAAAAHRNALTEDFNKGHALS